MSKHYQEAEALRKRARIALEQAHDAAAESSPSGDICRISAAVETLADVVDDLSSLLRDVLEAGDAKPTKPKASPTDAEALEVAVTLLTSALHIVGAVDERNMIPTPGAAVHVWKNQSTEWREAARNWVKAVATFNEKIG